MITGAHFLLYSNQPEADRTFFRDVLNFPAVDLGRGWLIFALPPAEMAVHPGSGDFAQVHADRRLAGAVLYLMCDELAGMMRMLEAKNVACGPVTEAEWGISTTVRLPSGLENRSLPAYARDRHRQGEMKKPQRKTRARTGLRESAWRCRTRPANATRPTRPSR